MYSQISDAFIDKYGDKAGWAHQILFAGDLASFKDKISTSPQKADPNPEKNDVTETAKSTTVRKRKFKESDVQEPAASGKTKIEERATRNKRRKLN